MKEQESTKLEFLMTVNDNIIVQRFFNVRDFNPNAKNSLELYEYLLSFKETFEDDLKMKTTIYMLDNIFEIINNPNILETSNTDGPEHFKIFIKHDGMVIYHREINAKLYPPKIRYTVDIRPYVKTLLNKLTSIFSAKKLTYEYLGVPLKS